jgi:hypothetical protein
MKMHRIRMLIMVLIAISVFIAGTDAQIVLSPPQAAGYVQAFGGTHSYQIFYSWYQPHENAIRASQYFIGGTWSWPMYFYVSKGVIEFDIDQTAGGNPFPTDSMTAHNWTAKLNGLTVTYAMASDGQLKAELFDLKDLNEDGAVTEDDYLGVMGNSITTLCTTPPEEGTVYNNIDVTQQLRRDLFGEGAGDDTSGFTLMVTNYLDIMNRVISFNVANPYIEIHIDGASTPTPTPTPVPGSESVSVDIQMPGNHFQPHDLFYCNVQVENTGSKPFLEAKLFVILDVYGKLYYAPFFTEFNYYSMDILTGLRTVSVVEEFTWPEGAGSAEDIKWYAGVTDPGITGLISDVDTETFSWSE